MPYVIVSNHPACPASRPFAVVKEGTTKRMGCHATRGEAREQQKALYAAESSSKETKVKAPIKRENGIDRPARDYAYVPDPASPSTWKLPLTDAPGRVSLSRLGMAAAALSPGGFRGNRVEIPATALSAVKRRILGEYRMLKVPEGKIPMSVKGGGQFTIWKDKASDLYRWMAVYSNNFLDRDSPPEIISEKSHTTFVQLVDEGIVDYPELWHWHIPGTAWGKADMLDYVDGFALAVGYVYPGHEKEAEALAGRTDLGVSHGMPFETLLYDSENPGVIDFHVTREISVLPHHAVANPLTDFVVLEKNLGGMEMAITPSKREWLLDKLGLDEDFVKELERNLKEMGTLARDIGLASKEADEEEIESDDEADEEVEYDEDEQEADEDEPAVKAQPSRRPRVREDSGRRKAAAMVEEKKPAARRGKKPGMSKAQDKEAAPASEPQYVTREEVATAFAEVLTPILDSLNETRATLVELGSVVKEMAQSDAERIANVKEQTPTASLRDLITNRIAIGRDEARIDGRTQLAKEGPQESKPEAASYTPSSFLNGLMETAVRGSAHDAQ